jgi:hypothetical protein
MSSCTIPWAPRIILTGRDFRLPVAAADERVELDAPAFGRIDSRWSSRDGAVYHYLRSPERPGSYRVRARRRLEGADGPEVAEASIRVCSLEELRTPFVYNDMQWPRRWPLGKTLSTTKTRRTMQDSAPERRENEAVAAWWLRQPDDVIGRQLPGAEIPRAHFVNVHEGSPTIGTAVFRNGGFYPWKRSHLPCDFRSICPVTGERFPSNDITRNDYTSGPFPDDGYGYFDRDGHIYLFVATYARDQYRAYEAGISAVTSSLGHSWSDEAARTLSLMLLRYAAEECYVAAVPQFRYGPSKAVEEPWEWGQPDWGAMTDPKRSLERSGTLRYCIDTPYAAETLAYAYDTVWPFLSSDAETALRARAMGLPVEEPSDAVALVEEMLACLLQCILDNAASSNFPRESQGAFAILRALDRPDAGEVLDWLYDEGPERLRTFTVNDFTPDGTPPEATGGYNSIHTDGVFDLEVQLRSLRSLHPERYGEAGYPSLLDDPRAARIAAVPHEITMCGRSWFQFGDGSAPGSATSYPSTRPDRSGIELVEPCFHAPMSPTTLDRAVAFTADPIVREIRDAVACGTHRVIGSTILDGVGIAILRTAEAPERAAVGIVYGDTTGHRHRDLLDVQLFAFGRPFLTDLGYPQSWASIGSWESHWATHNTVWGSLDDEPDGRIAGRVAGRGRVVRRLEAEGVQVLDIAADRWIFADGRWGKPGVSYRRLIALVETDGDGIAVVDLSRIRGGAIHWRTCRGLEGIFASSELRLRSLPGTVAGNAIERGRLDLVETPDGSALAWLDEPSADEVGGRSWSGKWSSRYESGVFLDVRQLAASDGTGLVSARATATMGTPDESNYEYRALLWRREPRSDGETTAVDLLFEPRLGEPTIAEAKEHTVDGTTEVELVTRAGRTVTIRWSPEAGDRGGIAVAVGNTVISAGWGERLRRPVIALDRRACTVTVPAAAELAVGALVAVNSDRGHVYRVTGTHVGVGDTTVVTLDVSSVLGASTIASVDGDVVTLADHIPARTGNLHSTRLERLIDEATAVIAEAYTPDRQSTVLRLDSRTAAFAPGDRVRIVDYVIGDLLTAELPKTGRRS